MSFARRLVSFFPVLFAGLTYVAAASFPLNARSIMSRQSPFDLSDIPPQCQADCSTLINSANDCITDACLCTDSVNESIADCYNCLIALIEVDQTTVNKGQSTLSDYEDLCNNEGFGLASLTVSGAAQGPTGAASTDEGFSSIFSATATGSASRQTFVSGSAARSGSPTTAGSASAVSPTQSIGFADTQSAASAETTSVVDSSGAVHLYGVSNAAALVLLGAVCVLLY